MLSIAFILCILLSYSPCKKLLFLALFYVGCKLLQKWFSKTLILYILANDATTIWEGTALIRSSCSPIIMLCPWLNPRSHKNPEPKLLFDYYFIVKL